MFGKDVARALKAHKGEVLVGMLTTHDVVYIKAVKADLIAWALLNKDSDCGVDLRVEDDGTLFVDNE